jgi:hypothetical protein
MTLMYRLIPVLIVFSLVGAGCKSDKSMVSGSKRPQAALWPVIDSADAKWGYINPKGEMMISPRFDFAGKFSEGLARISMEGLFGYVDTTGQLIVRPHYLRASDYADGRARVRVDAGQSRFYLDRDGVAVIPPDTNRADAKDFSDGLAAVLSAGKWGYIDTTGTLKIPYTYAAGGKFLEGTAPVKLVESWGLIDKQGSWIIPAKYSWLDNQHEGLIRARLRDQGPPIWIFLNFQDQIQLKLPDYEEVWPFSESLAHAKKNGKWGFLDKKGKPAIEMKFESASAFSEGFAAVKADSLWGYIDKKGKWTITPRFTSADPFRGGLAYVNLGKRWGYIDKTGKIIWRSSELSELPMQEAN